MGMKAAMDVIDQLASKGLFRVRDLNAFRLSHTWLEYAEFFDCATPQCRGVWSHPRYQPSATNIVACKNRPASLPPLTIT